MFDDRLWCLKLAYLSDIIEKINEINIKMQGPETNIIKFKDTLTAFLEKLKNLICKPEAGNWAMFERVSECLKNDFDFDDDTKECIVSHLKSLQIKLDRAKY